MVFSSLSFIYLFFPVVFLLYFVIKNRTWRNGILLIASLLFYSWGEPKFLLSMLAASFVAYLGGLLITYFDERRRVKGKFISCLASVLLITGNLFVFKYFNFTVDTVETITGIQLFVPEILLPIGISFYTFQILSYVIDLYRGNVETQRNYFWLLLYVSFFPQLIAGPIVRYQTVEEEILHRRESVDEVASGTKRFIVGLSKKVLIANNVGAIAETIYGGNTAIFGGAMYWIAALAFTLQIYFDFSGYSDMAIGLGRIFGFHFLENFNYPYISCSITEFWRRWHISLSSWFRDYIYIPLGGNRVSKGHWIFNILLVWAVTGLWHGASWNFVLWGLYYGILLLLEKLVLHRLLDKLPKIFGWIYTAFFVMIGWVLFNLTDPTQLLQALKIMFTFPATDWLGVLRVDATLLQGLIYLPLGIVCSFPILTKLKKEQGVAVTILSYVVCAILALICIVYLVSNKYNPFIYFRF